MAYDRVLPPGTVVAGEWQIERKLGEGGFGITYAARNLRIGGVVALKDISNDLLTGAGHSDKTAADFVCQAIQPVTPDMSLGSALEHFMTHQGERLPVVRAMDDPVLLGAVHKTSLLDAYVRLSGGV